VDPVRERRALDAFDAAASWPEASRETRLAALLGDDPALIEMVRALLTAEQDAELLPTRAPPLAEAGHRSLPPEQVGAYRLTGMIGRGGMGLVYRGERIDGGFEQTVAIKLIRAGLFTASAAEQFARERQILARLHHPHITQLYDGGLTDGGQSYIVMELVGGVPLLDHARSAGLGLDERLNLFTDVCGAIDYAHREGVVHADIKPSNIIVDPLHGVKLLDFGISGLIGDPDATPGQRSATPMFASPQQIAHCPASAADDIHALGVLLQVLAEDQAGSDAELAAIVAKARAPEPADRYGSAGDLAGDIDRRRRGLPVSALAASPFRSLRFFWRRNRLSVSLAMTAAAGLVAAVAVMTILYVQAEGARRQADQRSDQVRSLSRYMLSDLTDALARFPGAGDLRAELARRGRTYLEGLGRVPRAPEDVRLEIAQGYAKTGDILAHLGRNGAGDPAAGKVDLGRAESGLRRLWTQTGGRDDVALALSRVLVAQAAIANEADNQPGRAAAKYSEACALADRVVSRARRSARAHLAHLDCLLGQAHLAYFQGDFHQVLARTDAALAEIHALPAGADPAAAALDEAVALDHRGDASFYLGDRAGALAAYRQAAAVLDRARDRAADVRLLDQLALTTYDIASTLDELGRKPEELVWIDRGVALADQIRTFEDTPHAWRTVAIVHLQRALTLAALGRFGEAVTEARTNVALRRVIAARSPHDYLAVRGVPVDLRALGTIYWEAGRRREACATFRESRLRWARLARSHGILDSDRSSEMLSLDRQLARCGGSP
jgi:tetratricopeptide (TPR) repeat protein